MKLFRRIIFWLHLIAGTIAGVVILIMSVTGAILAFQPQIEWYFERDARAILRPPGSQHHLEAGALLDKVLAARPEAKPSGLTVYANDQAATVALGREATIFVNPYTGEITGESNKAARGFFHEVTDWHRWLAGHGEYRAVGKAVTGWSNLAFLFLAISGVYLWFPRKLTWQHLKPVTVFKWNLSGRARDFNWHNVIGFWSSLVLIILTATGVVISFQWAGNLVYYATGNQPPAPQQQRPPQPPNEQNAQNAQPFVAPANLGALFERARQQSEGWKSIAVRFPIGKEAVFTVDEGKSRNVFGRSNLTLNPETAEVVKWESYNDQNAGRQLRSWMRFTHTGESFGIVGQTIAFLACVGGAVLVWTGFSLAWRRFRGWLAKRAVKTQTEI